MGVLLPSDAGGGELGAPLAARKGEGDEELAGEEGVVDEAEPELRLEGTKKVAAF